MIDPAALPSAVTTYLLSLATDDLSLAYVHVTQEGLVMSWGGDGPKYGVNTLQVGDCVSDRLFFLTGFFPLQSVTEVLPNIQINSGELASELIIDVHLITQATEGWIVLIDSTAEANKMQQLQQTGNELSLLRYQHKKLLATLSQQSEGVSHLIGPADHQRASVMLVNFSAFNAHLAVVSELLSAEGGVIHHVFGETIAVLFGLVPGQTDSAEPNSAQQSFCAAKRLIQNVHQGINNRGQTASLKTAVPPRTVMNGVLGDLSIAIATGQISVDIFPVSGLRSLNVIGEPVQTVPRLMAFSSPGNFVMDEPTVQSLDVNRSCFQQELFHQPEKSAYLYKLAFEHLDI